MINNKYHSMIIKGTKGKVYIELDNELVQATNAELAGMILFDLAEVMDFQIEFNGEPKQYANTEKKRKNLVQRIFAYLF